MNFVSQLKMKSISDWVFSQLVSVVSSRPLSRTDTLLNEEPANEVIGEQAQVSSPLATLTSEGGSQSPTCNQESHVHEFSQHPEVGISCQITDERKLSPVIKIEKLQIKFLRLVQRLGMSQNNPLVTKVLYRIHLATLIRAGESDLKRANLSSERVREIATRQEEAGSPELDFSFKILVLGKTGVGKSATINSIFDQTKAATNAFQPATDRIREVVGTVNGMRITFIDTPGLLPMSSSTLRRNKKILFSIKRYIRSSPPDIVLYFERLDLIDVGYTDFRLLKQITEVFGPGIWFNTIVVMTHASSMLPEGSNGYPISYDSLVKRCKDLVQHYIHQAVADTKIDNLVLLVENHHECKTNYMGAKILPNGEVWKSQFLLLCICTKVLGDVSALLNFQGSMEVGPPNDSRMPSLPHLLSSLLHHCTPHLEGEMNEESPSDDDDDEEEYDQLPPIRILTKSQFARLTNSQKKDYLDELDYRETLYMKKQLKEESRKRRESKALNRSLTNDDRYDNQDASPEAVLLPDMAVPLNFDSDSPVHRYRCLVTDDKWLVRPVLDPQGWDHDIGFDGVNLETALVVHDIHASITGQMSKDKQDFSVQSEGAAVYADQRGGIYSVGVDVQSAGRNVDLIYTLRSNAKFRNLKCNIPECGISLTSFGDKHLVGAKLEDTIFIGKRMKLLANAGRIGGPGQTAYGGTFEATVRGKDYPVKDDKFSLMMSVLSTNKDMVLSGGFHTDFRPNRGLLMSIDANVNNRKMGQISIKARSSDHLEIALVALFSIFRVLLRRKRTIDLNGEIVEAE